MKDEAKPRNVIDVEKYGDRFQRVIVDVEGRRRYSRDVADPLALALRGLTKEEILAVANENEGGARIARYFETLNPGQFRMTVGHFLRARLRHKKVVTVKGEPVQTG